MTKKKKQSEEMPARTDEDQDVVEIDYEAESEGSFDMAKKLKKLKAELKKVKEEKAEYLNGWQKERADFANFKKSQDENVKALSGYAREQILEEFLKVLDSFNMAFANREAWEGVDESWRKGVEYIYEQMNGIFAEYGVEPVGEVGEAFDPAVHQSVETVPTDNKKDDHKIAAVIQKGYKIADRTLRPARVNVFEVKEE